VTAAAGVAPIDMFANDANGPAVKLKLVAASVAEIASAPVEAVLIFDKNVASPIVAAP
jgi:hypothetical protein